MAEINAARWLVDYRSGKSHLARSGNSSCPLKKFILPARENIVQIKFLRKLKLIMPWWWRRTFPEWVLLSWRNKWPKCYVSRWKQRRTKQQFGKCCKHCFYNTLMASFCMERLLFVKKFTLYFRRLNFFLWILLFCCYSKCTARNRQYIRLKVAAAKVFFVFFLQSQNKLRSNKAI